MTASWSTTTEVEVGRRNMREGEVTHLTASFKLEAVRTTR